MSQLLLLGNPRRRSAARKSRKARSPAQRAATARMLAANRSKRNPARRSAARPAAGRTARRVSRRSSRPAFAGLRMQGASITSMLKSGAIGGAGALGNDVLFGIASKILPAGWVSPTNADGSTNWMYFAAKAGTAVALAKFGGKVLPAGVSGKLADGALVVLSYQIMRGMMPAGSVPLGYYNPVPTMAPRRLGAYVGDTAPMNRTLGAYVATGPQAAVVNQGANVARMLRTAR